MSLEIDLLVQSITNAKRPEDVFGVIPDGATHDRVSAMKKVFHRIVLVVHPDKNPGAKSLGDVMTKLVAFRTEAESLLADGTYGIARKAKVTASLISKRGTYKITEEFRTGDVANILLGEFDGTKYLLKVVRKPGDNDLLDNEVRVLRELHAKKGDQAVTFQKYLPKVAESFVILEGKTNRRVNVMDVAEGCYSLAEIKAAYPEGIDARDAAWMVRRAMEGLGWVHEVGYVHGAVLPEHILVHPIGHSARLVGWSYAVKTGQKLTAVSAPRKGMYPPSVFAKEPATPKLDVQMLGATAELMLSDAKGAMRSDLPPEVVAFFLKCRRGEIADGWTAYRAYDEVLGKVYGKRAYRAFAMPAHK